MRNWHHDKGRDLYSWPENHTNLDRMRMRKNSCIAYLIYRIKARKRKGLQVGPRILCIEQYNHQSYSSELEKVPSLSVICESPSHTYMLKEKEKKAIIGKIQSSFKLLKFILLRAHLYFHHLQ